MGPFLGAAIGARLHISPVSELELEVHAGEERKTGLTYREKELKTGAMDYCCRRSLEATKQGPKGALCL